MHKAAAASAQGDLGILMEMFPVCKSPWASHSQHVRLCRLSLPVRKVVHPPVNLISHSAQLRMRIGCQS